MIGAADSRAAAPPPTTPRRRPSIGARPTRRHAAPRRQGRLHRLRALAPPLDIDGPRVRLGLLWFAVTFALTAAGTVALTPWMAVVGALAGAQTARSWRRAQKQPVVPLCLLAGAAIPALSAAGLLGTLTASVAIALGALVWEPARALLGRFDEASRTSARHTVAVALPIGVAAAVPVLARHLGLTYGLVLLALVSVHDASSYIVGSGGSNHWEGPVAGAAATLAGTLAIAAVLAPPFEGASPWILGGLLAVLVPVGPYVASALLGDRSARVPVLRRIDGFLVAGPLWLLAAWLLTG